MQAFCYKPGHGCAALSGEDSGGHRGHHKVRGSPPVKAGPWGFQPQCAWLLGPSPLSLAHQARELLIERKLRRSW